MMPSSPGVHRVNNRRFYARRVRRQQLECLSDEQVFRVLVADARRAVLRGDRNALVEAVLDLRFPTVRNAGRNQGAAA